MYIKESDLKEKNLNLERIRNNAFYECHNDNKDHNIKAVISYYSYVAIVINDNIIIDEYYYNYSSTTNTLIYKESSYKNKYIVDHESFKKLLNHYRFNNTNDLYKSFFKLNDKKQLNLKIFDIVERGGGLLELERAGLDMKNKFINYKDIELKTRKKHINYFKVNNIKLEEVITTKKTKKYQELKRTLKIMNDYNYFEKSAGGVLSIE